VGRRRPDEKEMINHEAERGRPDGRGALARDKRFWASTRWGCEATGPAAGLILQRILNSQGFCP
jgi:hypothetical protein